MNVQIHYEPLKLISACAKIRQEYQNRYDYECPPSGHLESLLEEISNLNLVGLADYAAMLKEYDIKYLAWHLPKEENLILNTKILRILSSRISKDIFDVYFSSWQKFYKVLSNHLGTKNLFLLSDLGSFLPEEMYTADLRSKMLLAQEDELISQCVSDLADRTNETYTDILSVFYLISPSSVLGITILKKIFLVCSEKQLLRTTDLELCNIANSYITEEEMQFFVNFVSKVSPNHYRDYLRLADLARVFFAKGKYRIENFETSVRIRFQMWFSLLDLDRIFGEDERGLFWKARAIENHAIRVEKKNKFNMVIMYFEQFVATEFLIQADGPIYIVDNAEFDAAMGGIIRRATSKTELKGDLYRRYQDTSSRIPHRGNWRNAAQYRIAQLKRYS